MADTRAWPDGLVVDEVSDMLGGVAALAVFDPTRVYRYWLERRVGAGDGTLTFLMLNPSVADAFRVDRTVNRCIGYARREGAGRLVVVNLFALRSPYPSDMRGHPDPVGGPTTDLLIDRAVAEADIVVAAWGGGSTAPRSLVAPRAAEVATRHAGRLMRLGDATKDGDPGHPLYLPGEVPLVPHLPAVLGG